MERARRMPGPCLQGVIVRFVPTLGRWHWVVGERFFDGDYPHTVRLQFRSPPLPVLHGPREPAVIVDQDPPERGGGCARGLSHHPVELSPASVHVSELDGRPQPVFLRLPPHVVELGLNRPVVIVGGPGIHRCQLDTFLGFCHVSVTSLVAFSVREGDHFMPRKIADDGDFGSFPGRIFTIRMFLADAMTPASWSALSSGL